MKPKNLTINFNSTGSDNTHLKLLFFGSILLFLFSIFLLFSPLMKYVNPLTWFQIKPDIVLSEFHEYCGIVGKSVEEFSKIILSFLKEHQIIPQHGMQTAPAPLQVPDNEKGIFFFLNGLLNNITQLLTMFSLNLILQRVSQGVEQGIVLFNTGVVLANNNALNFMERVQRMEEIITSLHSKHKTEAQAFSDAKDTADSAMEESIQESIKENPNLGQTQQQLIDLSHETADGKVFNANGEIENPSLITGLLSAMRVIVDEETLGVLALTDTVIDSGEIVPVEEAPPAPEVRRIVSRENTTSIKQQKFRNSRMPSDSMNEIFDMYNNQARITEIDDEALVNTSISIS